MSQELIAILSLAGTLLSVVLSFILGKRWERNKQSLLIRAQMLDPISTWLGGVEKFAGILGDTLSSISVPSPVPLTYDFEERRQSAQFMIENTNEVLGILESESLITRRTKDDASELSDLILNLNESIRYTLLPLDHEILGRVRRGTITEEFIIQVGETKLGIEGQIQLAYSKIARIKTRLT